MQLQMTYEPAEDRLLLFIGLPDRADSFWLTRRITALLWRALWQMAGAPLDNEASDSSKEWQLSLQQNEVRQKHAISQEPRKKSDTPPILVTTLQYGNEDSEAKDGKSHLLGFLDASGQGVKLTLDDTTLHALIRLLDEAMVASEWRLDLWRPLSSISVVSPASRSLH